MAIEGVRPYIEFPTKNFVGKDFVLELDNISDEKFFQLIITSIKPNLRNIAKNQLKSYFNQIKYHPERISIYIKKINQLIRLEMKGENNE